MLMQGLTLVAIAQVPSVTAALAIRHGCNVSAGRFAEEIAFVAVVIPVGMQTYRAILHDLEARALEGEGDETKGAEPIGWMLVM